MSNLVGSSRSMSGSALLRQLQFLIVAYVTTQCASPPDRRSAQLSQAIVGGQQAPDASWDMVVQIDTRCTGTVIDAHRIVTAAHCVEEAGVAIATIQDRWSPDGGDNTGKKLQVHCQKRAEATIGTGDDIAVCT